MCDEEDQYKWIEEDALSVRHGHSLQLMIDACTLFNTEFKTINPTKDWKKWQRKGMKLHYVAIYDYSLDDPLVAASRFILDQPDVVIDYIVTREDQQGRGISRHVFTIVHDIKTQNDCLGELYVTAIEDSCPYWMEKGFQLVDDAMLNNKYNLFDDTHLLRQN